MTWEQHMLAMVEQLKKQLIRERRRASVQKKRAEHWRRRALAKTRFYR